MTVWRPIRFGYMQGRGDTPADAADHLRKHGWAPAVAALTPKARRRREGPKWVAALPETLLDRLFRTNPLPHTGPAVVGGVPAGVAAGSTGLGDLVLVLVQLGKFKSVD